MTEKISDLTPADLRDMIESAVHSAVEQALFELLGDPDEGLDLRDSIRSRLERQTADVAAGQRGRSLEDALDEAGPE